MKFVLLALLLSFFAHADFVFMRESLEGKSIQLQSGSISSTLSDSNNGNWALYPDITVDGQEIVYAEGPSGTDLHLTLHNKKRETTIRFHHPIQGMILHPKFSKNSKWLFYSAPSSFGKNSIFYFDFKLEVKKQGNFVVDYHIQNPLPLNPGEEAYFPRPSSDGGFVVYQRNTAGKKEIVLFNRVDDEKRILAEGMSPALSFDERLVAYTSKKDGNWNIYVIDRVTGQVTQMTSDLSDEMAPTFRTDNSLAFASNKSGSFRLYQLDHGKKWNSLTEDHDTEVSHYSPQFSGEKKYLQTELNTYPGNGRSSFGTVFHQGSLYMAGGHQGQEHTYPPESFMDELKVYHPQTKLWRDLAPRPVKAHGYQLAAYGNYLYAFGGFTYSAQHKPRWKSLSTIDRYDINQNKWETVGNLQAPRSSNVAITIQDKVYLVGGWDSTPQKENDAEGRFHDVIEIFDLKSEKLSQTNYKMPLPLRRAFTGIAHQGKLVLIGGLGVGASHFELLNQVTAIDPNTGLSSEMTPMPFATFAPAAGVIDNELLIFGGMFKTGTMNFEYVSHIYALNFQDKQWRHTGRYVQETKGFSQVFNLNENMLGILGGHHYFEGNDFPVRTFETFSK